MHQSRPAHACWASGCRVCPDLWVQLKPLCLPSKSTMAFGPSDVELARVEKDLG